MIWLLYILSANGMTPPVVVPMQSEAHCRAERALLPDGLVAVCGAMVSGRGV